MWKLLKEYIQLKIDSLKFVDKPLTDIELMRKLLGSINLEDVRDITKTHEQVREYEASISAVFLQYIEPTIKKLIIAQEQFMGRNAETMDQLSFGRGSVNGLLILLEEFEKAHNNHLSSMKPKESIDPTAYFPETPTLESLTQERST